MSIKRFAQLALLLAAPALAQTVPLAISYQAVLTDDQDPPQPLSPASPTNFAVQFRIFDALEDGNQLWSEAQNVSVFQGSFSTLLGTGDPITGEVRPQLDTIFDNNMRYLEITLVDGGTPKTFNPRQRMVSAPFAFRASIADTADTVVPGKIVAASLASNAVTRAKVANDAIDSAKIANNSVTSADIQDGAVNINELANAVANRLVPAGTVTAWAGVPNTVTKSGTTLQGIPSGWILCDGNSFNRFKYPELFKAVGYIYGGSGGFPRTPDYRGYFLRGQASTTNQNLRDEQDPDRANRIMSSDWARDNSLLEGSFQKDEFKEHNHHNAEWKFLMSLATASQRATATTFDVTDKEPNIRTVRESSSVGGKETRPINRYAWYIIKAH